MRRSAGFLICIQHHLIFPSRLALIPDSVAMRRFLALTKSLGSWLEFDSFKESLTQINLSNGNLVEILTMGECNWINDCPDGASAMDGYVV